MSNNICIIQFPFRQLVLFQAGLILKLVCRYIATTMRQAEFRMRSRHLHLPLALPSTPPLAARGVNPLAAPFDARYRPVDVYRSAFLYRKQRAIPL